MKHLFYSLFAAGLLLTATACDDQLDIKPLGKTTLDKVEDLESLLNQRPILSVGDDFNEMEALCGNMYHNWKGLDEVTGNPNSLTYAIYYCDETVDRANLTTSDDRYTQLYENINYMNVVISKMADAAGDATRKPQLVAEARVWRAWYHFLLVNLYAQQYDPATAKQLGGIAYVDNTHVGEQKTKRTLAETYSRILEDCSDEVLADLIPHHVDDPCRFGLDFGYGVRARVLFQMKRYDEALTYANKALQVNPTIEDRSTIANTWNWLLSYDAPNNYQLINADGSNLGDYYGICVSPEVAALISPNDYINAYVWGAWGAPYPALPDGALQCSVSDIRFNIWGLRSESMYYLAAECLIRSGKVREGLTQVDRVRNLRIENNESYAAQADALDEASAMQLLQDAKRLEFLNTFENFFDRKRWNSEPAYAADVVHLKMDGSQVVLKPNSPLWVFPFPQNAVLYNSSLTQNF